VGHRVRDILDEVWGEICLVVNYDTVSRADGTLRYLLRYKVKIIPKWEKDINMIDDKKKYAA